MPIVKCVQEEEGNLNRAAQAVLLDNNQQASAIDVYLMQNFNKTVTAVENCSDADCM